MADEQVQHLTIALCATLKADEKKDEPFDPLDFIDKNYKVAEGIFNVGKAIGDGESFLDIVVTGLGCMGQWGGLLGKIIKAIAGSGGNSNENKIINEKLDKILGELKKISQQLINVREDIAQGVADIIAHIDAAAYRDKITVPSNRLWVLLSKVFESPSERSLNEFLELCKDLSYRPKLLITDMFTYLAGDDDNILMTQLKSKDYAYSTLDKWRACFQVHMMTLAAANVFYYSFSEEQNSKVVEEEVSDMLQQVKKLAVRMFDLDNKRAQMINLSGVAEKKANEVLYNGSSKQLFDNMKDLIGERPFAVVRADHLGKNFSPSMCTLVQNGDVYGFAVIIPQLEIASQNKEKNYDSVLEDIDQAAKKIIPNDLKDGFRADKPDWVLGEMSEESKKRLIYMNVTDGKTPEKPPADGWLSPSDNLKGMDYTATEDIEKAGVIKRYIMSYARDPKYDPDGLWRVFYAYQIVTAFIM